MDIKDICWLAGIIEGEGSITITNHITPRITVKMTDEDIIARVAKIWKQDYYKLGSTVGKTQWGVNVNNKKAIGWIFILYSLFGKRRRERAREIIQFWKNCNWNGNDTHCKRGHLRIRSNQVDNGNGMICLLCRKIRQEERKIKSWEETSS